MWPTVAAGWASRWEQTALGGCHQSSSSSFYLLKWYEITFSYDSTWAGQTRLQSSYELHISKLWRCCWCEPKSGSALLRCTHANLCTFWFQWMWSKCGKVYCDKIGDGIESESHKQTQWRIQKFWKGETVYQPRRHLHKFTFVFLT